MIRVAKVSFWHDFTPIAARELGKFYYQSKCDPIIRGPLSDSEPVNPCQVETKHV